ERCRPQPRAQRLLWRSGDLSAVAPRHVQSMKIPEINEAAERRPLCNQAAKAKRESLPSDPPATAPIAAAFMLFEHEFLARSPFPVVRMHDDPRAVRIVISIVRMPADMAGADNSCRCAHR